ncbi:MAG: hypothetical protein J2P54_06640 [Bradyrhizobiaceae bacterium]|nr:hypothetical protein [Bradyrhizobiaceae bacterium]
MIGTRGVLTTVALFTAFASVSVWAQQPQSLRIRGTIEKFDGNTLSVKSRDGAEMQVKLTDDARVVDVVNASLSEIKEGVFVGSAAMPQADGSQKALEVHIFPESMRGTGEGHRPYTIPNSTMTNGTVGATVASVEGSTVTLKYKEGEKKIIVGPGIPIVRYEIGNKSDLKAGAAFTILSAEKKPDGTLETARVNVGRDGVVPQ